MQLFEYWARRTGLARNKEGADWLLTSWSGSNISPQDAIGKAEQRLASLSARLAQKNKLDQYAYLIERSVREKVIERFGDSDKPFAAITRNRYGALVLNTATVFFADVDIPIDKDATPDDVHKHKTYRKPVSPEDGFFARLFGLGKKVSYQELRAEQQQTIQQRFADFHSRFPSLDFRVYESAAGYRVVVTNQPADPDGHDSSTWLETLESDPLYRAMCKRQDCYRARLTPKPWRLPNSDVPEFQPDIPDGEHPYALDWLREYEEQSRSFSVCRLIVTYGDGDMTEEAAEVIRIHDGYVLNESAMDLA